MASHAPVEQCPVVIVGQSPATVCLRAQIARAAPFASNVLITGPTGTGKELVARQVHTHSPRARQPFIPVDCAAITGELMSSQLFGHVAGAFTGANCDSLGCFRAANRGTLFLDEIGELDYVLQSKLLRVLQDHVVTPVGSHRGERVDVRVVAATNRDLRREVLAGRFREDLYYRLDVVHLRTTALCERQQDIVPLAEAFLEQLAGEGLPKCTLSVDARGALLDFQWPGNVRQLRNVMEQAAIESSSPVILADGIRRIISASLSHTDDWDHDDWHNNDCDNPLECLDPTPTVPPEIQRPSLGRREWLTLDAVERQHIHQTLEHTYFNRSAAARLLGLTRQSLLRKMKRHGLDGRGEGVN
jgi:DNA-binding NtrC family response regulator